MNPFTRHQGLVVPLERINVDTDAIIPKQYLKSILRTGFGTNLFDEWRYLDPDTIGQSAQQRRLNPDFVLNYPQYQGASILLTGKNFGCGSSREHAPWALQQYGFCAIIAPSFADIFFNNCYKNGLLPIVLSETIVAQLTAVCKAQIGYQLTIDLPQQLVQTKDASYPFEITEFRKYCLVNGLDEIGLSLRHQDSIQQFESEYFQRYPWLARTN